MNLRSLPTLRRNVLRGTKLYWRLRERFLQNYLFIHINKTGGRSVESALGCLYEHKTARQKRIEVGDDMWEGKFTFAFVRNPWDRVVSQYFYREKTEQNEAAGEDVDFKQWVLRVYRDQDSSLRNREHLFLPQSEWVTDEEGAVIVDFVGRFERFEEDFEHVCKQIGADARLPHKNRSSRAAYPSYYDAETRNVITEYFREDIERFDYSF